MGDESCGTRCVQFILFMLNFIFFLCGVGFIVVGIFIWIGPISAFNFNIIDLAVILDNPYLETGCFIMIGAGILIVVFSLVGCCGAFLLNRCLLGLYFFVIIVLFFAQLAGAVLAAIYSAEIDNFVNKEFNEFLRENYKYNNDSFTKAIDLLQEKFECCGVVSQHDYDEIPDSQGIPKSCCNTAVGNVPDGATCIYYNNGCSEAVKDLLTQNATVIGASLVGVACLELFLMVFSVVLCRNASEKDDY